MQEEVKRFIRTHINAVEQLEVLLLLKKDSRQEWSAEAVSRALLIQPESAARRLDDLYSCELLAVQSTPKLTYRYQPRHSRQAELVDGVERAYRERKDAVIEVIVSQPFNPRPYF